MNRERRCATCHGEGKVECINEMLDLELRDPSDVEGCPECVRANVIIVEYVHRPIDRWRTVAHSARSDTVAITARCLRTRIALEKHTIALFLDPQCGYD